MAKIRVGSHAQGQARRSVGFACKYNRRRQAEWKKFFAVDSNSWRSFPMGRNLADRVGSPLVHVAGTIQGNGSNDRSQ